MRSGQTRATAAEVTIAADAIKSKKERKNGKKKPKRARALEKGREGARENDRVCVICRRRAARGERTISGECERDGTGRRDNRHKENRTGGGVGGAGGASETLPAGREGASVIGWRRGGGK